MAKNHSTNNRRGTGKIILIVANILLLVGLTGFGGYYFYQYQQLKKKPAELAQKAQDAEVKQIVKDVGDRVELPKNEQPTIYTVEDKSKLAGQAFFEKAENGDKALIYSAAKIAILYRPSTKKIINVGPVNVAQSITPTVVIIGSLEARDAMEKTMNEKLKDKFKLGAKLDAKIEPTEVLVVDVTGTNAETAKTFAETLGGKVGPLPQGEDKPANTDIVVIAK